VTIVDFITEAEKREELIWKCGCGNCAFILYHDHRIECSDCGKFQTGIDMSMTVRKWTRKSNDTPED